MPFFDPIRIGASGTVADYTVDRSLRFNTTDQTVLTSSLSTSPTNRKKTTLSFWFKKSKLSAEEGVIVSGASGTGGSASGTRIYLNADDTFKVATIVSNTTIWSLDTNRKFRDPSAWIHFCMSLDTTQSTASDRVKIYFNGVQETSFSSASYPSQNYDDIWAYGNYRIGDYGGDYGYYYGYNSYIAEVITIDGQALDPSSFTETDATTGQLIPKNPSSLSFGTNGFHLKFADNSGTTATTLGKDSSGNGNNFTPNNFATSDAVKDSPTNNFCTFNVLSNYDGMTLAQGSLKANSGGGWDQVRGTMGVSSGKWYFEIRCNEIDGGAGVERWIGGIQEMVPRNTDEYFIYSGGYTAATYGYAYGVQDNNQRRTNGGSDDAFSSDVAPGKVVGVRMNLDDNEILISVDGVDKGKMYDIQGGRIYTPLLNVNNSGTGGTLNCGQDSTFHGQETAGGNSDGGGIGDFAYAVPSGYKALCSANLPDPTILLPNKYFDTFLYTATGNAMSFSGLNFQPDWIWQKSRNSTGSSNVHYTMDAVRGGDKGLVINSNNAEFSGADITFTSNGYDMGASTGGQGNGASNTYVSWNWNAGGSTVTNNDGSISSQVRANTTAGFSIVGYTGTGSAATIGHGLGVAPKWLVVKLRSGSQDWFVNNGMILNDLGKYYKLNSSGSSNVSDTNVFPNTAPTSTVFSVGTDSAVNASGSTYVAYVFSEVEGYSKFVAYTGNGSTDGTFVYTGFAPAFMIQRKETDTNWHMMDSTRDPLNPNTLGIDPNLSSAEADDSNLAIDFLSNGFKLRTSHSTANGSGTKYILLAFAESPFKNSRAR
jgi:hypothetical protein